MLCTTSIWLNVLIRICNCLAGSRSSSPSSQRSTASNRLVMGPPDVAAVHRPGSSLGLRPKAPTHRVTQSQGNSRETSPDRLRFGYAAANSIVHRQSDLEAAVADAMVSDRSCNDQDNDNSNNSSETNRILALLMAVNWSYLLIWTILVKWPFSRTTWISQHQNSILGSTGVKCSGGDGCNWSCKTSKAPVKSSPPTNQHPPL